MGKPKEGIPLGDGRPMIRHVLAALEEVCLRTMVVGECLGFDCPAHTAHLLDLRPRGGPLAGVETLLHSGLDAGYLVVACDQPLLSPALLARVVAADPARPCFLRPDDGSWLGPFPGYFPAACLERIDLAIRRGVTSLRRVFADSEITWVPISTAEQAQLKDFNSPADLAELSQSGPVVPTFPDQDSS